MVRSGDGVSSIFNGKIGLTVNGVLIATLYRELSFSGYRDIVFTVDSRIIDFFGSIGLCIFIRVTVSILCICTFGRSIFLFRIGGSLITYRIFRVFIKVNIQIPCFSDNRGNFRVREGEIIEDKIYIAVSLQFDLSFTELSAKLIGSRFVNRDGFSFCRSAVAINGNRIILNSNDGFLSLGNGFSIRKGCGIRILSGCAAGI